MRYVDFIIHTNICVDFTYRRMLKWYKIHMFVCEKSEVIAINTNQQPRADEEPDEWENHEEYDEPYIIGSAYSHNYGRSEGMNEKRTLSLTEKELEILEFCIAFLNVIQERLTENGEISEDFSALVKPKCKKRKKVGF